MPSQLAICAPFALAAPAEYGIDKSYYLKGHLLDAKYFTNSSFLFPLHLNLW